MSFWSKLKDRLGRRDSAPPDDATPHDGPPPAPPPLVATPPPSPSAPKDDVVAFSARIGTEGGPTVEAILGWIRQHRGTLAEGALVRALAEAAPRAPEVVRVATAELLAARGEEERALEVLEDVSTPAGLVLAADLLAAAGQTARAVTMIERVLARSIDAPGARERHARWRASLGMDLARGGRLDEATVAQMSPEEAPFRVLREVARGGAGTVYEAEDELLGRRIAFKVHHARGDDRQALEREIRATAALAGPGVVRLFDASPAQGWVALEWVPRGSLRDVLRRGDAPELVASGAWIAPLLHALARLHRMGWVHGDVKPANVLLRDAADPILGDFGLARRSGAASRGGSPGYVSPERLAGQPVDPRDDVYGFGRILEDCLDALPEGRREPLRRVVEACLRPAGRRPADAQAVLALHDATRTTQRAVEA